MSRQQAPRRRRTVTMRSSIRRLAPAIALAIGATLVASPTEALPPGAPKTGMVCEPGSVASGTHTFDLVATSGHVQTPEGNSVLMWSYASGSGSFQYPG